MEPNTSKILLRKICRIVLETEKKTIKGTGFFLCFLIDLELFYCLLKCDHVVNKESINKKRIIYLTFGEYNAANIKLEIEDILRVL